MQRIVPKVGLVACLAIAISAMACSDVGDDMPGETNDSGAPGSDATPPDSYAPSAESGAAADTGGGNDQPDSTVQDGALDANTGEDATLDASTPDTSIPETSVADTSVSDTGVPDTSTHDAGAPDTSVTDAGAVDANLDTGAPIDAGPTDTGSSDTGKSDAGIFDTGAPDTGAPDTGAPDTGVHDSGTDAGVSPCAAYNGGAGCTPTEQRLVDKSPECYRCMLNAGCIDDAFFGDTGHECGDVSGNATAGAKSGSSRTSLCLATLDCIMTPAIECASDDVNICYCGTLGSGNGCATAASGANGKCFQAEVDGLEHLATDAPSAVLPDYTDLRRGAGMANQLFVCAKANQCDTLCAQ